MESIIMMLNTTPQKVTILSLLQVIPTKFWLVFHQFLYMNIRNAKRLRGPKRVTLWSYMDQWYLKNVIFSGVIDLIFFNKNKLLKKNIVSFWECTEKSSG